MGTSAFGKVASVAILTGVVSIGCQWKGEKRDRGASSDSETDRTAATQPDLPGTDAWRPAPVSMRVYPSSRFVQEGALTVLEARIELLDEMGDTIKGSGRFHFELAESATAETPGSGTPGSGVAGVPGQRLYAWDVPLTTLEEQRQYWDPITRTYQFRLKMNAAPPPNATVLRALLTPSDSQHITAEAGIRQ
jgi:hypothetical protein